MSIITKEEYIAAKKIVRLYEEQQKKGIIVGVIVYDLKDFELWKSEQYFDSSLLWEEKQDRFIYDNKKYKLIRSLNDCRGWQFDEIIETDMAVHNREYEKIKFGILTKK
jgi:hypothetical protein